MIVRKFQTGIVCVSLFLATMLCADIIFSENFDAVKDGLSLKEMNWQVKATDTQSLWKVEDGVLKATCFNNPYNGGFVEKEVPLLRKGRLDFDANIAIEGRGNARGIAFAVELYNISTWFHDYCGDWRRYFPEPPSKRIEGFNIEPVGHKKLATIKKGEWNHYRIDFDADEGIVEYYFNDMTDPVHVDADVPVLGRAEYQDRYLRLASIGFVDGPVTYAIDNIVLADAQSAGDENEVEKKEENILVFQGISSNEYNVTEALKGIEGYTIREYWTEVIMSLIPINKFRMGKLPGRSTLDTSKVLLFVDQPLGPDCIPEYFIGRLEKWVKDGGVLITLGGPFSYGKGMYKGTLLERLLPVEIAGLWEVKRASLPLTIKPTASFSVFTERIREDRPAVYYYHALDLKEGVKILIDSEQSVPLWVYWSYGKGRVISFVGTAMGKSDDKSIIFYEWKEWGNLLQEIVRWALD